MALAVNGKNKSTSNRKMNEMDVGFRVWCREMDIQKKNMRGNSGLIGMYNVQGLSLTCWWLAERKKGQEREHHGHIRACTRGYSRDDSAIHYVQPVSLEISLKPRKGTLLYCIKFWCTTRSKLKIRNPCLPSG